MGMERELKCLSHPPPDLSRNLKQETKRQMGLCLRPLVKSTNQRPEFSIFPRIEVSEKPRAPAGGRARGRVFVNVDDSSIMYLIIISPSNISPLTRCFFSFFPFSFFFAIQIIN